MTNKISERANMPEVSAAAFNTLDRLKQINNQPAKQDKKKIILEECLMCNKKYDRISTAKILGDLPTLPNFDYEYICLACIKEASQQIKASAQPVLKQLREEQIKMNKAYQESYNKWKAVCNKYQALDKQVAMIDHHLTKLTKTKAAKTVKPTKTTAQTNEDAAMKALKSLSKEQQAAILKLIAKQ